MRPSTVESCDHLSMSDEFPVPRGGALPATDDIIPAKDLGPGTFKRADWELVLSTDGWYVREGVAPARRITVGDAVAKIGRLGRGPVFTATREYIADLGRTLGDDAYLSPVGEPRTAAERQMRDRGLDPKLPAEQIASAGHIIGRLGDELTEAEAAPPIV